MADRLQLTFSLKTEDGATTYFSANGDLFDEDRCKVIADRLSCAGFDVKLVRVVNTLVEWD